MAPVLAPATLGILGGGQLGRMTALAARSLGMGVQVLDPDANCAARPVVDRVVAAAFDDVDGARELARASAVITIEIEQIAPAALAAAMELAPVRPGPELLRVVQHRGRQKQWLHDNGFPVGSYAHVSSAEELAVAAHDIGPALFVKACEGGYDGRSQIRFDGSDAPTAWAALGGRQAVAEQALDLELELSVLVARRASGDVVVYPPAVNHHERQILAWSVLPGELDPVVAREARSLARGIAESFALEGILAVEMFLLRDGRLLVNELAPRPHNSYHASELACPTSQFEQLVRAVCDLPLGDAEPVRPAAIVNLFGDLWLRDRAPDFAAALGVSGTRLFLYGKHGARAGRKMGHLAAIGDTADDALRRVQRAASLL
ncbi:MAG TPA: 5-(carboxyamino)imidazole ribonucleotide synthase [Gemmatimonadaceae bacterium]|jgi:5-(carboxyamino)imidazole ribonucleotide synthase|nr:5-(carboxyamino)imidazole ribonucleotide synthase [Gemmatimonadaceae bacterium]